MTNKELRDAVVIDEKQPLWMPRGSVRAILAIGITSATIAAAFQGVSGDGLAMLSGLTGAVNVYYFKTREDA